MSVTLSNTASITIPSSGAASPYPSAITVSGLAGTITDVNATLKGFAHTWPDDVDILLVGPGGEKVVLMSDAGGGEAVSGIDLTFDDEAASDIPDSSPPALTTGSYRPEDYYVPVETEIYPSPAPAGPYTTLLSAFDGTNPNGTWSLYVMDDTPDDSGSIAGGWEIAISTSQPSLDFGDAPDPTYPTLVASNGARHIATGPYLGSLRDGELDGQPSAGATGDDTNGVDDEDGVVFTSGLVAGQMATVDVTASAGAMLDAWIDFNGDGDWDDAGEQIFNDEAVTTGVNHLSFAVPAIGAGSEAGTTYARFRIST